MQQFADSYALLPAAAAIGTRLIQSVPHFAHLSEARLLYVSSQRQPMLHGHPCQAFVAKPKVQGPFHWFFEWLVSGFAGQVLEGEDPDFIVMVDAALWESYDATKREWLVYHELRHIEQKTDENGIPKFSQEDGKPMWKLVPHDAEFFFDEVERYGPEVTGQVESTIALATGHRNAQERDGAEQRDRAATVHGDASDGAVRRPVRRGNR